MGVEGIKIKIFGCFNGVEMVCIEMYKDGCILLYMFRVDIDYVVGEVLIIYGLIGIKVWICKGEVYGCCDFFLNVGMVVQVVKGGVFLGDRGGCCLDCKGGLNDCCGGGNLRKK